MENGLGHITRNLPDMKPGEVWLVGCDIPQYLQASEWNHDPRRPRKLLLHQREIKKFAEDEKKRIDSLGKGKVDCMRS